MKWARGEGVFIGPKSSGRPVQGAYVWCYCTAVQWLSRTFRYYPECILKSSRRPVLSVYVRYYYTAVQMPFRMIKYYPMDYVNSVAYIATFGVRLLYYSQIVLFVSGRPMGDHHTSALKDRGVCLPTLAYIQSKSPIS